MSRKKLFLATTALVWLSAVPAHLWPQSPTVEIEVGQLWMNVKGYDEHVGDLVRQTLVISDSPSVTDERTRSPLKLNMQAGNTLQADVRYRKGRWGIGARGWFFSSDDAFGGRATSLETQVTSSAATVVVDTVSMWKETLLPVTNELEDSGFSSVDFRVAEGLRTYTFDSFALRTLSESDDHRIDLVAGAKLGRLETDQSMGFTERSFVFDFFSPGVHFNNFIELKSAADAAFLGVGPMAGLEVDTRWRWLGIHASASQALLIGNSTETGLFTDIDEITTAADPAGPFTPCTIALAGQGCVPIESNIRFAAAERTFLPVSELKLSLEVHITESIAIRSNAFAAIWGTTPVPPTFIITHLAAGPGLNWELERRTLLFGGAGISVLLGL